jgi:hypothetical protein
MDDVLHLSVIVDVRLLHHLLHLLQEQLAK